MVLHDTSNYLIHQTGFDLYRSNQAKAQAYGRRQNARNPTRFSLRDWSRAFMYVIEKAYYCLMLYVMMSSDFFRQHIEELLGEWGQWPLLPTPLTLNNSMGCMHMQALCLLPLCEKKGTRLAYVCTYVRIALPSSSSGVLPFYNKKTLYNSCLLL